MCTLLWHAMAGLQEKVSKNHPTDAGFNEAGLLVRVTCVTVRTHDDTAAPPVESAADSEALRAAKKKQPFSWRLLQ